MTIKLYNDDCMNIIKSLDNVDLVLTDIPYGEVNRNSNGLRNLNKGLADEIFDLDINKLVNDLIDKCNGSIYIFCGTMQISNIVEIMRTRKLSVRVGVWRKTNPSPMNGDKIWLSGLEFCVFGKKPKATFNEHCKLPVWETSSGRNKLHKTQKPIDLFEQIILASSNIGDTVLDCCMGSATTGISCLMNNRNFIGIEKDKNTFRVASNRLLQFVPNQGHILPGLKNA